MTPPPISNVASLAPAGWESSLAGRFMSALFRAYYDESVRYAVLRNYERWPEHFGKDVDLVVHQNDLPVSHAIVQRIAAAQGLVWTVRAKRSGHVTYYVTPRTPDGTESGLLLDLRPDVVHQGFIYLPGERVLDSRRLDHGGFYVPSAALESLGILLHCVLDARTVRESYRARLLELGLGDPAEFRAVAESIVGRKLALALAEAIDAGAPERALQLRGALFRACALRNPEAPKRWVRSRAGAVADKLRATLRPPGHLVILVGPDGCGKTTSAELVCERFAATRVPVSAVYLGAQKPLLPTRKLSQKLRKRRARAGAPREIKDVNRRQRLRGLVHIMADKWARYLLQVRPRLVRGEVVVLDRYFYDLRVFPHPLVRKGWVERVVMACIPEPALAFCLTADPALITARKNELTVAETTRQIECYRGLRRWVRNFGELPADGDRPKVIDRIAGDVLALYASHRAPERI